MAVHRELVSAGKFDEKFRRALLDYYGYGYKPLASYDNWRRLNGILADYLDWAEEPGAVRFASADSEQMEENPFHRVYRFCKYKPVAYPATFLHTLALLSGEFSLRRCQRRCKRTRSGRCIWRMCWRRAVLSKRRTCWR